MGAGHFPQEFGQYFRDKLVVVLPDNDEPGRRHAKLVVDVVKPYAKSVVVLALPDLGEGEDVSNYLARHPAEELGAELYRIDWNKQS